GLQSGFTDSLQVQVAQILCSRTGAERVRFTSSGSLATMYAIMLARAATGREKVLKIGGGWHGAQPWGLVGVDYHTENGSSFQHSESRGLPSAVADQVLVTSFNDVGMLEEKFRRNGSRIACFIVEPFMGSSGSLPASLAFLKKARELTQKHGALLIFDEVISGFRFCAGSASRVFQVQPDLATFAKIIGGGMPVAAVGGKADVMELAGRAGGVRFSGGTYSCHPSSMLASVTMMRHLVSHEQEIYPRLALLGEEARATVQEALRAGGLNARCTGRGNDALPDSSLASVHFPYDEGCSCDTPEQTRNPDVCDVVLSDTVLQLALLLEDVFVMHGLGSLSMAHTHKDISRLGDACRKAAQRIVSLL
ncbi:MAG TPA: aminotransferase class III-fold pyridoxal phosphate-dependent enzyme, partial [Spirochaetia bacterium]|nr:aminotransferase class III-fold pyridoxal phosphate-dependent enzyme [Spirochaetia bacterium]